MRVQPSQNSLPRAAPYQYETKLGDLPALTGDVKADYAALRRFVEETHRAGGSGHTVVRLQSAAMDRIVVALWQRAVGEALVKHKPSALSLVALGGYGRRELAPYSDLDLLVLHRPGDPDPFTKMASERFLYSLWDLRLEVGYGVRDVKACDDLASTDHTARTALLDLRWLSGDKPLYRELERDQLHGLSQAKVEAFIADKVAEMRERREKFGDSLYLLEPSVKQSEGGLRDLQMALWMARARFKVAGITELLARALLPEREIAELRRARDFVWRARNEMHYLAGRKSDQLTFDVQPQVAAFMGYRDADGEPATEEFMRHYYLAAKTILVACDAIIDRCLEPGEASGWRMVPPPAATLGAERTLPVLRGKSPRAADWFLPGGEFKVFRGRLSIADKELLRKSPAALVRFFATADREGLELYSYARDQAAQVAAELPPEAASDPELNQELLSCFVRPGTRGRFLTLMHDLGVLERVLPEFARITARRQIDVYHVYTVDVHSLFAVRRLFALRAGDVQVESLTPLMQKLERPLGLYLGTLFHDIGKGLGGDHSVRGAEIAAAACVRIGIDPADAADVEWLVLKHLRMAAIAQRRDLSDPDLIHAFAEECGSADRLDKLYLLTYADISTVGPRTWTDWKARLLRELYEKTRAVLSAGARRRPEPGTWEAAGRARVEQALQGRASAEDVSRFVAAMPARYFLTESPAAAPRHLRLLRIGRRHAVATAIRHRPELGHSDLALTALDRPGLLALVAGVLAAHRIDIQHAEVFSSPPDEQALGWLAGRALDLFEVRGPEEGAIEPARWRAARADLERVLSGEEALEPLMARRLRASSIPQKPLPRVPTKVIIDNDSAREHSVVDVFTADRVGLLHTLSKTFFDLGLSVDLARITTEGHRAADAFYVRTPDGRRLEGEEAKRVSEAVTRPCRGHDLGGMGREPWTLTMHGSAVSSCSMEKPEMSEKQPARFLTTVEVASACGVSARTVGNWIRAGSIPAHRTVGGHARIAADDLRRFLDDRHIPVPPSLAGPAPARAGPEARLRPLVLVIDDDEPLLDVMGELLAAGGWDVETARHGFLGGYLVGLRRPDAIVLDIMMPGLDGFEALALLRRRPEAKGIPVVACTSLVGPEIEAKLRDAGFDSYVRKPVDFTALLQTLEALRR